MEKVPIDDAPNEPNPLGVNTIRRSLSKALGAEDVALAHYELEPDEQFSGGVHTHHDQEEIFYVIEGTATFEVRDLDDRDEAFEVEVSAGELVRFPPGQFQCGRNESDDRVVGLAIGAPGARHDWDALESLVPCSECGEVTSHSVGEPDAEGTMPIHCNECGTSLF